MSIKKVQFSHTQAPEYGLPRQEVLCQSPENRNEGREDWVWLNERGICGNNLIGSVDLRIGGRARHARG